MCSSGDIDRDPSARRQHRRPPTWLSERRQSLSEGRRLGEADNDKKQRARLRPICSTKKMKRALEMALASDHPIPLNHLAQQLGYHDATVVEKRFPELCRAIREKRDPWNAQRILHIRRVASLALQEEPPPSLAEIARRVNIGMRKTLRKYCPNVGELLTERRAAYRAACLAHREAALRSALVETPPPSIRHVARRLRLSKNTLKRGFRSLCRAIGIRYRKSLRAGTIGHDGPAHYQTVALLPDSTIS
jgi:AraC-like DNA-binding protein